jgi:hypothetical protein
MAEEIQTIHLGEATGPTPEMQQAAPWITGGFWLMVFAFLLYSCFAVSAAKRRTPGCWFTLSGLVIIALYFIFQNTLAQDAELRYGPVADALSLAVYSIGGVMLAIGYARTVLYVRDYSRAR